MKKIITILFILSFMIGYVQANNERKILSQMDAKILILILFLPIVCFGQKSKYPKDTIYIKFKDSIFTNTKMKSKSIYNFKGKMELNFGGKESGCFMIKIEKLIPYTSNT